MATKPSGGGALGLSGRATKKITFFCGFLSAERNKSNFHIHTHIKFYIRLCTG